MRPILERNTVSPLTSAFPAGGKDRSNPVNARGGMQHFQDRAAHLQITFLNEDIWGGKVDGVISPPLTIYPRHRLKQVLLIFMHCNAYAALFPDRRCRLVMIRMAVRANNQVDIFKRNSVLLEFFL